MTKENIKEIVCDRDAGEIVVYYTDDSYRCIDTSETVLDYITNLQLYKSRNDKAIEYIKEHFVVGLVRTQELLNILQGGDKE